MRNFILALLILSMPASAGITPGINSLLPDQTGNSGKILTTDGTEPSWTAAGGGGITELTGDVTAGPGSGSQSSTITANSVTSSKMRGTNNQFLRWRNSGGTADVNVLNLNAADVVVLGPSENARVYLDDASGAASMYSSTNIDLLTDLININSYSGVTSTPLRLYDANGTNYSVLKSDDNLSVNTLFQLPPNNGTNGYVLTTNGSGVTSWAAPSGGGNWYDTALPNDTFLKGRNQANDGDVNILKVNTSNNVVLSNAQTINSSANGLTMTSASNSIEISAPAASQQILLIADFLDVYGGGAAASTMRMYDNTGLAYAAIKAPAAVTGDYTLTLPVDDGTSGQVLSTNGAGVTSWVNDAGITWSTPVNADIIPDGSSTRSIGSPANNFLQGNIATIETNSIQDIVDNGINFYVQGQFQFESEYDLMDIYGGHGSSMNINLWDNDYNFYSTFKSANTLAANTLFQLPGTNGADGDLLKTDGTGQTSWITPNYANTDLGNLGVTSIVQDLLFGVGTVKIGSSSTPLDTLWSYRLYSPNTIDIDSGTGSVNVVNYASFKTDVALSTDTWSGTNPLPSLVIDGTTTAATTAYGAGILFNGDYSQSTFTILTKDATSSGSSDLWMGTGYNSQTAGLTGEVVIFTGDITNASNAGVPSRIRLKAGTNATTNSQGNVQVDAGLLKVNAGVAVTKLTADPCADTVKFPEATQFYNDTSDYYCFCNGAGNDVKMHDPATACF